MLRFVVVPSTILLTALPAAAERPAPTEMTEVKDAAEACAEAHDTLPSTAKCSVVGKVEVKGLGTAELVVVDGGEVVQYAIAIRTAGKQLVSERLMLVAHNCGMMKCDVIDRQQPKLRALRNGTVALEVTVQAHHEYTDERGPKAKQVTTDRWDQVSIIACGNRSGAIECVTREWGGRHNSCKAKLGDDGSVTTSCTTTEPVGL